MEIWTKKRKIGDTNKRTRAKKAWEFKVDKTFLGDIWSAVFLRKQKYGEAPLKEVSQIIPRVN